MEPDGPELTPVYCVRFGVLFGAAWDLRLVRGELAKRRMFACLGYRAVFLAMSLPFLKKDKKEIRCYRF